MLKVIDANENKKVIRCLETGEEITVNNTKAARCLQFLTDNPNIPIDNRFLNHEIFVPVRNKNIPRLHDLELEFLRKRFGSLSWLEKSPEDYLKHLQIYMWNKHLNGTTADCEDADPKLISLKSPDNLDLARFALMSRLLNRIIGSCHYASTGEIRLAFNKLQDEIKSHSQNLIDKIIEKLKIDKFWSWWNGLII